MWEEFQSLLDLDRTSGVLFEPMSCDTLTDNRPWTDVRLIDTYKRARAIEG